MNKIAISLYIPIGIYLFMNLLTANHSGNMSFNEIETISNGGLSILNQFGLDTIPSLHIINMGESYNGLNMRLNYMITYTPIIVIFLFLFTSSKKTKKLEEKKPIYNGTNSFTNSGYMSLFIIPLHIIKISKKIIFYLIPDNNVSKGFYLLLSMIMITMGSLAAGLVVLGYLSIQEGLERFSRAI